MNTKDIPRYTVEECQTIYKMLKDEEFLALEILNSSCKLIPWFFIKRIEVAIRHFIPCNLTRNAILIQCRKRSTHELKKVHKKR